MGNGKLVRDQIPRIIKETGLMPLIRVATPQEYSEFLRRKLVEEVQEFLASEDLEELADIMEVVFALTEDLNSCPEELEKVRSMKALARGTFINRTIWLGNTVIREG